MRDLGSPLGGFRSPFGALSGSVFDPYAVAGFNPALVFDFAAELYGTSSIVSTFNNSLTYTGASAKTMVDSDGLLKWAPHNLRTYSNDFTNAAWAMNGSATKSTVSANSPTGDTTVGKVTLASGANSLAGITMGIGAGTWLYSFGVFLKPSGLDWVGIESGFRDLTWFDITSGVIGTTSANHTASIADVGDGWFLCTINTQTVWNGGGQVWGCDSDNTQTGTGDGSIGYFISGGHIYYDNFGMVNNPDRGDSYVPTTSAAVYRPRRGHHIYNGTAWVNEGIQLESEARTNLFTYSADFANAAWTKSNSTAPATATSPTGVANSAATLTWNDTPASAGYLFHPVTVATAVVYTFSAYAKVGTVNYISLSLRSFTTPGNVDTHFNLSTGAVVSTGTGCTSNIENVGSGWYRCSITFTTDAADTTGEALLVLSENGTDFPLSTAGANALIYGAQMELGSTPSSYIPTAGATVTRAAETLTVAAANLPYSAVNMSMQMDGEMTYADEAAAAQLTLARWYADASNYIILDVDTDTTATGEINANQNAVGTLDTVVATAEYSPGVNIDVNVSSRHTSGAINVAKDGTAATEDATPTALPDLSATNMTIAYDYMGTIGKFRMWDEDLGDTGIAEAST